MWLIWLTFLPSFFSLSINKWTKWRLLSFLFLQNAGKRKAGICSNVFARYIRLSSFWFSYLYEYLVYLTQASDFFLRNKYLGLGLLHCMSANGDGLTTTTTSTTKKGFRCRLLWCLVVSKSQGLGMRRPAVGPIHSHDKRESGCRH